MDFDFSACIYGHYPYCANVFSQQLTDAEIIRRLRATGAVIIARSNNNLIEMEKFTVLNKPAKCIRIPISIAKHFPIHYL